LRKSIALSGKMKNRSRPKDKRTAMASVVFLRGVNVGGRRPLRSALLAKELPALDVVSIGAAGTFVVRAAASRSALRGELLRRIPFRPEIMIVPARQVVELVAAEPFAGETVRGARPFVSVLARRPRTLPRLPLRRPEGKPWQVEIAGIRGKFCLSLWRRTGQAMLYPNEVVEKELGVPATTRNWDTILRIHAVLRAG
jgi:uncharacterized protein (DUF1697 family)